MWSSRFDAAAITERLARAAGHQTAVREELVLRDAAPARPASVLLPLIGPGRDWAGDEDGSWRLLFIRRAEHDQDRHSGEVAFPGGRADPGDRDPVATALREAQEEIGLDESTIEIAGRLDTYQTGTGFEVTPVVGLVTPPVDLSPDPIEVAEVFEVPLAFILDPANHQRETRHYRGVERRFWVLPYRHYYIWGATAAMLVNLSEVLREA